jgi:hypothetical protein
MTFLVRECYGSPKKHEFYRSTGEHSVNIRTEECFDKVLYHVNSQILKCKMKNVITMNFMIEESLQNQILFFGREMDTMQSIMDS